MNIAIVEDMQEDSRHLCNLLYDLTPCFQIDFEIDEIRDAETFSGKFIPGKYDIIFLDIFLGDNSGMEIARKIREEDTRVSIIFTTFSSDFAVDSYSVRAAYYLVKPISPEALTEALNVCMGSKLRETRYVEVLSTRKIKRICMSDILYATLSRNAVILYTVNGKETVYTSFIRFIPKLLKDKRFLRCYHGCVVNMDHIIYAEGDSFHMDDGSMVQMRKKDASGIKALYSQYIFDKALKTRGE
jgi:DNA-binding LytR/AlgR family response regulator